MRRPPDAPARDTIRFVTEHIRVAATGRTAWRRIAARPVVAHAHEAPPDALKDLSSSCPAPARIDSDEGVLLPSKLVNSRCKICSGNGLGLPTIHFVRRGCLGDMITVSFTGLPRARTQLAAADNTAWRHAPRNSTGGHGEKDIDEETLCTRWTYGRLRLHLDR